MTMNLEVDSALELEVDDAEYYVECTIKGTCSYAPAILGGPPEDCSPEESDCDIESIRVTHAKTLLDATEITDPALLKKIELALDEDWAAERLWEEYEAAELEVEDEDDGDLDEDTFETP